MRASRRQLALLRWISLPVLLLIVPGLVLAERPIERPVQGPLALPEPRPKLILSSKEVQPAVVAPGGTLTYTIVLRNTGATAAPDAHLGDSFPAGTSYNGDGQASSGTLIEGPTGLTWTGAVAFDSSVEITFSVTTMATYTGRLTNTAVLTQSDIPVALTLTAVCTITDYPILGLFKEAGPALPGAGKPLTFTLWIANGGQPTTGLPITVTEQVPADTTLLSTGSGAITDTAGHITWTLPLTLALGERLPLTFTVLVDEGVPSGTVLLNDLYALHSAEPEVSADGRPYTITVVSPELLLVKETEPDPPGSNDTFIYTLTVYNYGSLATDLVVTDTVPTNVTYLDGGSYVSATGVVSWSLSSLAPLANAGFTYSVAVGNLPGGTLIVNDDYGVTCAEGIQAPGQPLTSTIQGPIFDESFKQVDPIAKKPGGGTSTLTYTIGIRNTGAGNALDAQMEDKFYYISFNPDQVEVDPLVGNFVLQGCGAHCEEMIWTGAVEHGSQITITVHEASTSYGGVPVVTNTAWISDDLTLPVSVTSKMLVTFQARLNVYKSGPDVIGPNELMTYTLRVHNSAFSADAPSWMTDEIPLDTTFITASDGGALISGTNTISWTLPPLSTGEQLTRTLTVQVGDVPSGTIIRNEDVWASCPNCAMTDVVFLPVTTTVLLRGLGDSYKEVSPALSYPGSAVALTYTVHVVNSSAFYLEGVRLTDYLPWAESTYNRDAVATAGSLISDIVHLNWVGDVGPHSEEAITLSVLVDPWYKGGVTNTAVITHPGLAAPVTVTAVAYVTDEPVLRLTKKASPDPVGRGEELAYTLYLYNLGQKATGLIISDTVPTNTTFVPGSVTRGGTFANDTVTWEWPEIAAGTVEPFGFRVVVNRGRYVLNEFYRAECAEGIWAVGAPLRTEVRGWMIYLPLLLKQAP